MENIMPILFLYVFFAIASVAKIEVETGVVNLTCGSNNIDIEYKISREKNDQANKKSAILLNGSPVTDYFSEEGGFYSEIMTNLRLAG